MAAEYPNCVFVAFLDDVTVLGPPARAYSYAALQRLQTLAETQREMKSGMSKCDVSVAAPLRDGLIHQTLKLVRRLGDGASALDTADAHLRGEDAADPKALFLLCGAAGGCRPLAPRGDLPRHNERIGSRQARRRRVSSPVLTLPLPLPLPLPLTLTLTGEPRLESSP